jgi:hypothetical protein
MSTNTEKRWDVVIIEDETRKIEAIVGSDLGHEGFHTVDKRIDTMLGRIDQEHFSVEGVPTGKYKEGDILPTDAETY